MGATAARFAADPRRRAMIAKVQIARKELGLVDDDYRQILLDVAGERSAGDCSEVQLARVLDRFKQRGWQPAIAAGRRGPAKAKPADHPMARKARAMWISLHQLGVVHNPAEEALEAFAARQLKVERLQWANQSQAYKLIEALKAMAERNGWHQDTPGMTPDVALRALKLRLCKAVFAKLVGAGHAPASWSIEDAAWHLLGIEELGSFTKRSGSSMTWSLGTRDLVAQGLGDKLRALAGAA